MDERRKDARRDVVITDIDALVPEENLLRKTEKVMDYLHARRSRFRLKAIPSLTD